MESIGIIYFYKTDRDDIGNPGGFMKKYIISLWLGVGLSANAVSFPDANVQTAAEVAITALSHKIENGRVESEFSIHYEYEVNCEDDQPILFHFDSDQQSCLVRVGSRSFDVLSIECAP